MREKKFSALAGFILVTEIKVAQAAITGGGTAQGILPMLQQLIGVEITNPGVAIGTAAAFGLMVALFYSVLKLGAEKIGVAESLTGGGRHSDGRNMILIISVLIGLSTVGTGFFGTLVNAYGLVSILFALFLLVIAAVALFYFLGSGSSGAASVASGAGKSLQAQGTEMQADAEEKIAKSKKKRAESEKRIQELKEEAQQIRGDVEEGDSESETEAVELEEDIINKVQSIVSDLDLEKDIQLTEQALEDLKNALKLEEDEGPKLGYASARINRANAYLTHLNSDILSNIGSGVSIDQPDYLDLLRQTPTSDPASKGGYELVITNSSIRTNIINQVANNSGNGKIKYPSDHASAGPGNIGGIDFSVRGNIESDLGGFSSEYQDYGICEALEDIEKARKQLKAVVEGTEEEDELEGEAFKDVVEAVEDIKTVHVLVGELHDLLSELEEDDEMLEKLAKNQNWKDLFDEVESDEDAVEDLDDYLKHLKDLENQAEPMLEEVHEVLSQFLDLDEQEIRRLDEDTHLIGEIISVTTNGSPNMKTSFQKIQSNWPASAGMTRDLDAALTELQNISQEISDECQDILNMLEAVEDVDKRDESEGREMVQELESLIG